MPPIPMTGRGRRGVTLVEMLIVMALIGLMVGITFPSVTAGIDTLRLGSASDSIVSFLNGGLNRAERRQEVVEVEILIDQNRLSMRSTQPGFERTLELPRGIEIVNVLPEIPSEHGRARRFLIFPGGTVPSFGVLIENRRRVRRIVRVDPITGTPKIERVLGP